LGRGLSALLGEATTEAAAAPSGGVRAARLVPVASIRPNEYQPRRTFKPEEMDELIGSVRSHGVLQPILVRRDPKDASRFELVAGERRWRAAQAAQLHEIPAVVRDLTDQESLALALIENLQRENLSPIEEARGYRRLMDEFKQTQEQLAAALGKSRSVIANAVRLLELPEEVQGMIEREAITAGHGRLLVGRADATLLAADWARAGLSVREAEDVLSAARGRKKLRGGAASGKKGRQGKSEILHDANTEDLERRLSASLGVQVRILHKKGTQSGVFQVFYSSLDQLDTIIDRVTGTWAAGVKSPPTQVSHAERGKRGLEAPRLVRQTKAGEE
jgi:ParB family chromosome partitioning protein